MVKSMTEAHKRPYRHPNYKTAYRVKNWREYEKSLRDRGDITLWISQDAIDAWTPPQNGKRGAQPVYSDVAIETALTFRLLFHLALRQTEGFLGPILRLMGVALPCPDHTTLSRRNATVVVRRKIDRAPQGPVCVIIDSTGLKICGQGEWHAQKHGEKKVRRWKKLHIGVDDQGQMIASTVTDSNQHDPSQVPALLDQIDQEIDRFIGDGIFDREPVYAAVEAHSPGARVIIPPRQDAVPSPTASSAPTQRDQHLLEIERDGRFAWKRTPDYYDQAYAENVFARFKRTFGDRLRTKRDESRSGNPHWPASCSIGCGNGVVLSPIRPAKIGCKFTNLVAGIFTNSQSDEVPWPYSAPCVECSDGPDSLEWLECHAHERPGKTHTHVAVGGDEAQTAALLLCQLSTQSHESNAATEVLFAQRRTHTASQDRSAAVPAVAVVAGPAGDV
jgi:hypothetical protein